MDKRIRYRVMLGTFVLFWMNSILFASAATTSHQPTNTTSIFEDFDGDHKADIVTATCVGGLYRISTNIRGHRQDLSVSMEGTPARDLGMVARDIDKDCDTDLLVVNKRTHKILHVLINDGQGSFKSEDSFIVPTYNFVTEITRNNRQNTGGDQFSSNVFSVKLLHDAASFVVSNISGKVFCRNIYFNFTSIEFLFSSQILAVFSPRSPPQL